MSDVTNAIRQTKLDPDVKGGVCSRSVEEDWIDVNGMVFGYDDGRPVACGNQK